MYTKTVQQLQKTYKMAIQYNFTSWIYIYIPINVHLTGICITEL